MHISVCGTNNISQNILKYFPHIWIPKLLDHDDPKLLDHTTSHILGICCRISLVPHIIVMDLNSVMMSNKHNAKLGIVLK